jgi:hypothetical protein
MSTKGEVMKRVLGVLCALYIGYTAACPTCIGRINVNNPSPFFSDDHFTNDPDDTAPAIEASRAEVVHDEHREDQ